MPYALLCAAVVLGVAGQILFKSGAEKPGDILQQFFNPLTIAGFAIYALSAGLYVVSLRKLPLSIAFPSVSLSYVAVAIAGYLLWQEPIGWPRIAGIALIVAGVVLVNVRA